MLKKILARIHLYRSAPELLKALELDQVAVA